MNDIEKKLYDAVIENDIEALANLLKEDEVDISFQMENGDTLLNIVKGRQSEEGLKTSSIEHNNINT